MPDIFEPKKQLGLEEGKQMEEKLKKITGVYFPQFVNFQSGDAIGYRYESHYQPDAYIFWDLGAAVVNETMPEKADKIKAIEEQGFRVLKNQLKDVNLSTNALDQATKILWEEMRIGFGRERIR